MKDKNKGNKLIKKYEISKRSNFFIICIVLIIITAFMYMIGVGCGIKYLTGISCPACGMTRAYIALLHGNIADAFKYHPLFLLAPFICIYMIEEIRPSFLKKHEKMGIIIMFLIAILFAIVYVIRMFVLKDNVVDVDIKNGLIVRILIWIKNGIISFF